MDASKTDKEVQSVGEFISRLDEHATGKRRLYRGQNVDKPLLPKIMRLADKYSIDPRDIDAIERKMLKRFAEESEPMRRHQRKLTDWELMSVAQHWGMPTRLLDWTANPLAALWFAVSVESCHHGDHGVVWMVEGPDEKNFREHDDVFKLPTTRFFKPPHLDRRIIAQSSWFSAYRHNRETFLPLEKQKKYSDRLTRFIIAGDRFQSLRRELRLLGVHHLAMFPDLEGLSREIEAEFRDTVSRPAPK
jgi:hypothetical protein